MPKVHPLKTIGVVQSYFSKASVVLVKLQERIEIDTTINIKGNTTSSFRQHISELRDEQGKEIEMANAGELVTFPISHKVRRNDLVSVQD